MYYVRFISILEKIMSSILFENTPCRICSVTFLSYFLGIPIDEVQLQQLAILKNVFDLVTLTFDLSLTFKPDIHILPLDLHAKLQVCMSICSAERVVLNTQAHTMSKLLHSSLTQDVNIARISLVEYDAKPT